MALMETNCKQRFADSPMDGCFAAVFGMTVVVHAWVLVKNLDANLAETR